MAQGPEPRERIDDPRGRVACSLQSGGFPLLILSFSGVMSDVGVFFCGGLVGGRRNFVTLGCSAPYGAVGAGGDSHRMGCGWGVSRPVFPFLEFVLSAFVLPSLKRPSFSAAPIRVPEPPAPSSTPTTTNTATPPTQHPAATDGSAANHAAVTISGESSSWEFGSIAPRSADSSKPTP